jgi:hypothetical protein
VIGVGGKTRQARHRPGQRRRQRRGHTIGFVFAVFGLITSPAHAHDAFGDLGPFYANFLHPLADPLQAAITVGTAALLAGRSLAITRVALPIFAGAATVAACVLVFATLNAASSMFGALAAVCVGIAAMVPGKWTPPAVTLVLVAAAGILTGLAPGVPDDRQVFQFILGTALGIAVFSTLAWSALEYGSRRYASVIAQVVGSWVAAIGILVVAFSA